MSGSAHDISIPRPWPGWAPPLAAWAGSRLVVLVFGLASSAALGLPERGVDPAVPHEIALLGGWDTTWYLNIARFGYEYDLGQVGHLFSNLAFFPLVPGLMALALVSGLNPFLAALAISNLALLGALWGLHALTRARFGERAAARATWVTAFLPTAFVASMAYTEGLTLALAIGAATVALQGRWALAGLAGAPAALARPTGMLVAALVVLLAWFADAPGRARRVALAVLPSLLALAGFLLWMQLARGSWTLPFAAQGAWERGQPILGLFTALPSEVGAGLEEAVAGRPRMIWLAMARDVAFAGLYLWLLVRLWRREGGLRSPWVGYSALVLAVPISTGSVASMGRFGLMAFPLVWPLADWLGDDRRRWAWAGAAALVVMALLVAQLASNSP
jgi:hypothetical protein